MNALRQPWHPAEAADPTAAGSAALAVTAQAAWAHSAARRIGRAAPLALYDELALSPKPGLVTLIDAGSHHDMDARTFWRSLLALRSYYAEVTTLGLQQAPLSALQASGLRAEARMLAATGGINTHRGAVFSLGLLCAAAGALLGQGLSQVPGPSQATGPAPAASVALRLHCDGIRRSLLLHWGDALATRAQQPSTLPGGRAAARLGLRSAAAEAALGFPALFEVAVPALQAALRRGQCLHSARLDTLFHLIAVLDDANLAHRGGLVGLRFARRAAQQFLAAGGAQRPDGLAHAQAIGRAFVARRLSPGGAADLLAATCWLHRVGALDTAATAGHGPPPTPSPAGATRP